MTKPVLFYHPNSQSDNEIRIDWSMGNEVDFRVPYLHNDFQTGDMPFPDKDTILQFLKTIYNSRRQSNTNRPLDWKLLGGEVTRHPDFIEIAQEINLEGGGLQIHTTGTRPPEFWEEAAPYLTNVTFDWHPEWVTENEILRAIEKLGDTHFSVQTWINPDNFEYCKKAENSIASKVTADVRQRLVFQDVNRTLGNYKNKQREELKKTDPDSFACVYGDSSVERISRSTMAIDDRRCFSGWVCNAGIDQLIITMQGDIYRGWCFVEKLGSIYDEDFELPTQPVVCTLPHCFNGFDQMAMKWDPDIDPEDYL